MIRFDPLCRSAAVESLLGLLKTGLINVCHSVAADTGKMPVLHASDSMSAHNTSPCG